MGLFSRERPPAPPTQDPATLIAARLEELRLACDRRLGELSSRIDEHQRLVSGLARQVAGLAEERMALTTQAASLLAGGSRRAVSRVALRLAEIASELPPLEHSLEQARDAGRRLQDAYAQAEAHARRQLAAVARNLAAIRAANTLAETAELAGTASEQALEYGSELDRLAQMAEEARIQAAARARIAISQPPG